MTVEIDTSTVQGFLFSAHVNLIWPRFIRKSCGRVVDFPLTQIGNLSVSIVLEATFTLDVVMNRKLL